MKRFWNKVDKTGDCWEWLAAKFLPPRLAYGRFKINGKTIPAHRYSWELVHGLIPNGLCVCHKCDNPGCVNPDHLFLGTYMDNNHDMMEKGRQYFPEGEDAYWSKLTTSQVRKIRGIYARGQISQSELARRFNTSQSRISRIVNRKQWKNI